MVSWQGEAWIALLLKGTSYQDETPISLVCSNQQRLTSDTVANTNVNY